MPTTHRPAFLAFLIAALFKRLSSLFIFTNLWETSI